MGPVSAGVADAIGNGFFVSAGRGDGEGNTDGDKSRTADSGLTGAADSERKNATISCTEVKNFPSAMKQIPIITRTDIVL
jgi:hypothetical protein